MSGFFSRFSKSRETQPSERSSSPSISVGSRCSSSTSDSPKKVHIGNSPRTDDPNIIFRGITSRSAGCMVSTEPSSGALVNRGTAFHGPPGTSGRYLRRKDIFDRAWFAHHLRGIKLGKNGKIKVTNPEEYEDDSSDEESESGSEKDVNGAGVGCVAVKKVDSVGEIERHRAEDRSMDAAVESASVVESQMEVSEVTESRKPREDDETVARKAAAIQPHETRDRPQDKAACGVDQTDAEVDAASEKLLEHSEKELNAAGNLSSNSKCILLRGFTTSDSRHALPGSYSIPVDPKTGLLRSTSPLTESDKKRKKVCISLKSRKVSDKLRSLKDLEVPDFLDSTSSEEEEGIPVSKVEPLQFRGENSDPDSHEPGHNATQMVFDEVASGTIPITECVSIASPHALKVDHVDKSPILLLEVASRTATQVVNEGDDAASLISASLMEGICTSSVTNGSQMNVEPLTQKIVPSVDEAPPPRPYFSRYVVESDAAEEERVVLEMSVLESYRNQVSILDIIMEFEAANSLCPTVIETARLKSGVVLLKQISRLLFSAREECGGTWGDFALAVGHSSEEVGVIVNNFRMRYIPMHVLPPHHVLAQCAESHHTLKKVFSAIAEIGQRKILCREEIVDQTRIFLQDYLERCRSQLESGCGNENSANPLLSAFEPHGIGLYTLDGGQQESQDVKDAASLFLRLLLGLEMEHQCSCSCSSNVLSKDSCSHETECPLGSGGVTKDGWMQKIEDACKKVLVDMMDAVSSAKMSSGGDGLKRGVSMINLPPPPPPPSEDGGPGGGESDRVTKRVPSLKHPRWTGPLVMVVYGDDAVEEAEYVKACFKSYTPRIAVVDLREYDDLIATALDPTMDRFLKEVDFVVPIISREYLSALRVKQVRNISGFSNRIVRFVHASMQSELFAAGVNRRVRPLVTLPLVRRAYDTYELNSPLYNSWKSVELASAMAALIVNTLEKRKMMSCGVSARGRKTKTISRWY